MTSQHTADLSATESLVAESEPGIETRILLPGRNMRMPRAPVVFYPRTYFRDPRNNILVSDGVLEYLPLDEELEPETTLTRYSMRKSASDTEFRDELPDQFGTSWWVLKTLMKSQLTFSEGFLNKGLNVAYIECVDDMAFTIKPEHNIWRLSVVPRGSVQYPKYTSVFGKKK